MQEEVKKIVKLAVCATFSVVLLVTPAFAFPFGKKITPAKNVSTQKPAVVETNAVATQTAGIVYTIDDCINYAIKKNPNIKISRDTQKAQKSAVGIAKSNYFPTLTGGTGYSINNTKISDPDASMNNNYYGLNLSVNQLIWDFGRTAARINMSKYNYEAAGYDLENVTLNSVYNVKIAYTAVLAARANVDIYARSVKINELNWQRAKAMYEVGLKSKIDVVNAEVYLTDAKISLLEAQNNYQSSLIALNSSMSYIDAPDYEIKDTETFNFQKDYSVRNEIDVAYDRKNFNEGGVEAEIKDGAILTSGIEKRNIIKTYKCKPFELTMQDSIKKAYENRPDLKSLELVKMASEESLKAIKKSYYPALNASAGGAYKKFSDYDSRAVGVYAGIDFPSVNGMAIKNQIDQAKSYLDIASLNIDLLRENIYFGVQNYYVSMKQLEKRIPLMGKKVEQTLTNFELADGRYAVGLGDYIELQQAQTNYNNAQLAFVQSVFDYNKARFYLEKSMGIR